jgi:hypothetical protein
MLILLWYSGADPGFQVRRARLKRLPRAEGSAKIIGVFCVKNHDFTPKNHIFSNLRGRARRVVVHKLQMCMKEYRWCLKFRRGDNSTYVQILDSDHISSCTSAGSVLQLCKVSQKSNKPYRGSCAYKVHDPLFHESIS